jgi:hypothetical protein
MLCRIQWPSGMRRSRLLAGVACSNPAGGMCVCLLWMLSVVRWRFLHGPIPRPEVFYWRSYVIVCDLETAKMRRPWPALGCCARERERTIHMYIKCCVVHILCIYLTGPQIQQFKYTVHKMFFFCMYRVVQIWPGRLVCKQVTVCPSHIWTTLYIHFWKWFVSVAGSACVLWGVARFERADQHVCGCNQTCGGFIAPTCTPPPRLWAWVEDRRDRNLCREIDKSNVYVCSY